MRRSVFQLVLAVLIFGAYGCRRADVRGREFTDRRAFTLRSEACCGVNGDLLRRALLDEAPAPLCQLVRIPSWEQPVAIYLERRDGQWLVVRRRVKIDGSWDALLEQVARERSASGDPNSPIPKTLPADSIRKAVESHESRLEDAVAKRVLAACDSVAQRSRQPGDGPKGADGVTYYFSNSDGNKTVYATAWSPGSSSESGVFVHMGEKLAEYVDAPRERQDKLLDEISADVDTLKPPSWR